MVGDFPTVSETFIVNQICDLIDRGHEISIFAFNSTREEIIHQKIKEYKLLEKTKYPEILHVSKAKRFFPFLSYLFSNSHNIDFKKLAQNFSVKEKGIKSFNLLFFINTNGY